MDAMLSLCGARDTATVRADNGRWRRRPGAKTPVDFEWVPYSCVARVFDANAAQRCLARKERAVLFVGDSHTRHIVGGTDENVLKGNYEKVENLVFNNGRENWLTDVPPLASNITSFVANHSFFSEAVNAFSAPLIILNFGTWDLRDGSAPSFFADWTYAIGEILHHLDACVHTGHCSPMARLVWRTMPSYSYKRDLWGAAEYRTNFKISWVTEQQRDFLRGLNEMRKQLGRASIEIHDAFAITSPFFSESIDTHHYIIRKPGGEICKTENKSCSFGADVGNFVGVADINALLTSICG